MEVTEKVLGGADMKRCILILAISTIAPSAFAWDDRYEIKTNPYGASVGDSTEIEMRMRHDYNPTNRFRGEIESDGSVRMRNLNGERLRGTIDEDGYGRLRDQDGNVYRVRPR